MKRRIIIGLDGVPYGLIKKFAEQGVMPNTAGLIDKGVFLQTQSTIPEVSSVAWSSIITGKNPAEHGIFGFTALAPDSYNMTFPNFTSLKAKPFWDEWPGPSVIINVPSTYPVRPMNGAHIAGFVAIDINKSVYPESLIPELQAMDYRLDVDSQKAHQSMEAFLRDLDETLDARIACGRRLWNQSNWRNFMLVFTGTDRLMHFLYEAVDENHRHHNDFIRHFQKIDAAIGNILSDMTPDDMLIMLSDHGFELLEQEVYINLLLAQEGYLKFQPGSAPSIQSIAPGTAAFAMDPARIYLNYRGKYPAGSVDSQDAPKILDSLAQLFAQLECNGKKVIRNIYRKDEVFHGSFLEEAPDLVLVSNHGFDLKAGLRSDRLFKKEIFSGKHTQDTAFALYAGNLDARTVQHVTSVADVIYATRD